MILFFLFLYCTYVVQSVHLLLTMANSVIYNLLFAKGTQLGGAKPTVGGVKNLLDLVNVKKVFLLQVFSNLIVQLGITYFVMQRTTNVRTNKHLLWLGSFVILIAMMLVPMHPVLKFILFSAFSAMLGLILSSLKSAFSSEAINMSIMGALSVFAAMIGTTVALIVGGFKLGYKFGAFLFWALLALIVARLMVALGGTAGMSQINMAFSVIGIILFALYIVFDTYTILQRNYAGDFITASMDYYLDVINLFINMVDPSS